MDPRSRSIAATAGAALLVGLTLASCAEEAPEAAPSPTLPPLVLSTPPPPEIPPLSTTPQVPPTAVRPDVSLEYPLTTEEAHALLEMGVAVAGHIPDGGVALAMKSTETVYENTQVPRETCAYEYDGYKNEEVWKCRDEYVTESAPVEKTVYKVAQDVVPKTCSTAIEAINYIRGYGVTAWRQAP